jgi:hypothetical protein
MIKMLFYTQSRKLTQVVYKGPLIFMQDKVLSVHQRTVVEKEK